MHVVLHGFFLQRVFLLGLNGVEIFSISDGFERSLVNSGGLVSGILFLYFDFQLVFVELLARLPLLEGSRIAALYFYVKIQIVADYVVLE